MGELVGWFGLILFFVGMVCISFALFSHIEELREDQEEKDEGLHDNNTDEI